MPSQDKILLLTKLQRPQIPRGLIDRPRLYARLNDAVDYPLTLISAPAGYGKTTLVSTWLNQTVLAQSELASPIPMAWLSIGEEDSDLNLFVRYFIAALRTVYPNVCAETLNLLQAMQLPPLAVFNTTFINDLESLPGEAVLVMDDYQFIRSKEVHELLSDLLRYWPIKLHLVIISRVDPPLPLSRMRAKRKILEIRTQDLRFSPEETKSYLDQAQFFHLNKNTLDLVDERFEGWPAGLHLAALSLRSATGQEAVHAAFSSENASITDYLVDEVLTHQYPAIHTFLLRTSILDRFCVSLCDAVIGEIDTTWNARACLDWIEHSDLFLIPLDNRREWYRYHHIFNELLQQRLFNEITSDEVNNLHRLASIWFEDHGLLGDALFHAITAGDYDLAAHQMSAGLCEVLNHVDIPTLEHWLHLVPEEIIQQQPQLLMVRAWALQFLWRLDQQARVLKQIEDLLDTEAGVPFPESDRQLLNAQILLMRAEQAYLSNQPGQAIDCCNQALVLLPQSWTFGRGAAMFYLGLSMQASGQADQAESMLLSEYELTADRIDIYTLLILESLCYVYMLTGQLEQTSRIAQLLVEGSSRTGIIYINRGAGEWFLGSLCYQRNELEAALHHFTNIVENRFLVQVSHFRDAVAGQAIVYQVQGQSSEAWQMVDSIRQYDLEQRGYEDIRTQSLQARLLLSDGNIEGAGRWADSQTGLPPNQPLVWLEEPQVTRAQVLIARGGDDDLRLAMEILDTLEQIVDRTFNTYYKVIILGLRALALNAQGETSQANTALEHAVRLGQQGMFIRAFVDLGNSMRTMLLQLGNQVYEPKSIKRILAAFPEDEKNWIVNQTSDEHPGPHSPGSSSLVEPLTRREQEVLALLREPASIKEIAQKLNISYATAKDHTIRIYAKLGVNRRAAAISKAEELKLFTHT